MVLKENITSLLLLLDSLLFFVHFPTPQHFCILLYILGFFTSFLTTNSKKFSCTPFHINIYTTEMEQLLNKHLSRSCVCMCLFAKFKYQKHKICNYSKQPLLGWCQKVTSLSSDDRFTFQIRKQGKGNVFCMTSRKPYHDLSYISEIKTHCYTS